MIFLSDRYGFNNPDSEWDVVQPEVMLLGDSFTMGYAVQQGEDIAGQIRLITGKSVISLGINSMGPLTELMALIEYGKSKKPKIVCWLYYNDNDVHDLSAEKRVQLLMRYLEPEFSQNLISRQEEIDDRLNKLVLTNTIHNETAMEPDTGLLWKTRMLRLHHLRRRLRADAPKERNYDYDDVVLFSKILKRSRDLVGTWGGKLYFAYLPAHARYAGYARKHGPLPEVIGVVKKLNIPIIDIHQETFANHPDPLSLFPFRLSGHYNAEGYNEVAKTIVSRIFVNKIENANNDF